MPSYPLELYPFFNTLYLHAFHLKKNIQRSTPGYKVIPPPMQCIKMKVILSLPAPGTPPHGKHNVSSEIG